MSSNTGRENAEQISYQEFLKKEEIFTNGYVTLATLLNILSFSI